jgi:hypothetical protein
LFRSDIFLDEIYTRGDELIPEFMQVLFLTNKAVYEISVASVSKTTVFNIGGFARAEFLDNLKAKYGDLQINDARITDDNDKYFLIANSFLLILYYELTSAFNNSVQDFRIVEDIYGINKAELTGFFDLDKLDFT